MAFRPGVRVAAAVHVQAKLADLLRMTDAELLDRVRELESTTLFQSLRAAGAVVVDPYPSARFAARRNAGRELPLASTGLSDALDGNGEVVRLIRRVGQKRFEAHFLFASALPDGERARLCGLSPADARRLREFVDRLYIQGEFAPAAPAAPPAAVYSPVAGFELAQGEPCIAFFSREIWKGRYRVDPENLERLSADSSPAEREAMRRFLKRLEFLDWRKSTLYRALEFILEAQRDYLIGGDLAKRRPLTQRALSERLGANPSLVYQLVSNKSVRLPWGLEVPLKSLLPNKKSLLKDRLHALAQEFPELSDERLGRLLHEDTGTRVSRRSVAQYRLELGLRRTRR
jgi:hypothetical protein